MFQCLPSSAWNLTEAAVELGKMVEHPNQSQPNPGLLADESPCNVYLTNIFNPHCIYWEVLQDFTPEMKAFNGLFERYHTENISNSISNPSISGVKSSWTTL